MSVYWLDEEAGETRDDLEAVLARDPSVTDRAPSLERPFRLRGRDFQRIFFERYGLDYLISYAAARAIELRVVSHPTRTKTCFEKAELLGWDPLRVIKALYFERVPTGDLYAVVVPETGCFVDRASLAEAIVVPPSDLRKASVLPAHMELGTCSPFIVASDIKDRGGAVVKILFDAQTLAEKRQENAVDDFSFGVDHRLSLQINYYHCYRMVHALYPDVVAEADLLPLSFKEHVVRTQGRLKVSYDFKSLSYRVAKFINSNHGAGDVSITNDRVDELDIPDVLVSPSPTRSRT